MRSFVKTAWPIDSLHCADGFRLIKIGQKKLFYIYFLCFFSSNPFLFFFDILGVHTTIQIPFDDNVEVAGVELDDEHYRKMEQMIKTLSNIVKMRANSTSTESE